MSAVEVDATTALLVSRNLLLEELVRWLSIPYGDNEPTFAGADGRGTIRAGADGEMVRDEPSAHAQVLHTLWHQATGREHVPQEVDRMMLQCDHCGAWHAEVRG